MNGLNFSGGTTEECGELAPQSTGLEGTKEYENSVMIKRKLRLDLKDRGRECSSAPTSPASNIAIFDLTWDEDESRSVKKFKGEEKEARGEEATGEGDARLAIKIRNIIRTLDKGVREVSKAALERNMKREIKETSARLRSLMSQLMTADAQRLLHSLGKPRMTGEGGDYETDETELRNEVVKIKMENENLTTENQRLNEKIRALETALILSPLKEITHMGRPECEGGQ